MRFKYTPKLYEFFSFLAVLWGKNRPENCWYYEEYKNKTIHQQYNKTKYTFWKSKCYRKRCNRPQHLKFGLVYHYTSKNHVRIFLVLTRPEVAYLVHSVCVWKFESEGYIFQTVMVVLTSKDPFMDGFSVFSEIYTKLWPRKIFHKVSASQAWLWGKIRPEHG